MKSRLKRPLLTAVIGGALFAGGAVTVPAFAATVPAGVPQAFQAKAPGDPSTSASASASSSPAPNPSASASSSPAPSSSASASSSPSNPPASTPPPNGADTTVPAGNFLLSSTALWIGQSTTLTQDRVIDNGTWDPGFVARVVDWGDGQTETVYAGQPPVKKSYAKVGTYKITFTLTDPAGNKRVVDKSVTVTQPVKATIDRTAVWHGQRFNVRFLNVPAGTTRINVRFGDGSALSLPGQSQVVGRMYHLYPRSSNPVAGTMRLTASYTNKAGESGQVEIGRVAIKNDVWKPRASITVPKNANRVSSWTTIRGTATDQGGGVQYVSIGLGRVTGNKQYCYAPTKVWVRVVNDAQSQRQCLVRVRAVNGRWSLAVKGMRKGPIAVTATAADWIGNTSAVALVTRNLNR